MRSSSAASILQLLLGDVGRPGGGIMALRGRATMQAPRTSPPVQPAARVPAHAPRSPRRASRSTWTASAPPARRATGRMLRHIVEPPEGLVGGCRHRQRLGLRLHSADQRGPRHLARTLMSMLKDQVEGYFLLGGAPAVGCRPTGGCSAWGCPTSSGSWCGTST
ncbi:hypothetical protein QJS66_21600 [Kocuria rhizophila]|nr:hypothetical protein QJS66_21600 [Kocuria rhizophila]